MATRAPIRYLLDTNICIYIAKGHPLAVRERFDRHAVNELAMSTITLGELRFGAEKIQARERAMATIEKLMQMIQPSPARCLWPPPSITATFVRYCKSKGNPLATMTCGWRHTHAPRAGFWSPTTRGNLSACPIC